MNLKNHPLIKLFAENQSIGQEWHVENKDNQSADIYLYDAIGGWYGIEASEFIKELDSINAKQINLFINSPGGDVFEARAIATALTRHKANITSYIDGVAASAASYIALAADQVEIAEGAFFMIHNAWAIGLGDKNDMLDLADLLDKIDNSIADDYSKKTHAEREQIVTWMNDETWFTAQEAVDHGFVDRRTTKQHPEQTTENQWNLSAYTHAPDQLKPQQPPRDYHREQLERRVAMLQQIG